MTRTLSILMLVLLAGCASNPDLTLPVSKNVGMAEPAISIPAKQHALAWDYKQWPMQFEVWATPDFSIPFKLVASVSTNYYPFTLNAGKTFYKVRAVNKAGLSDWATTKG